MLKIFMPAMVAMLVATPAAAQDLNFDIGATLACQNGASDNGAARGCVGVAADACMQATPGGFSTVVMGGCYDLELTYWDARLNGIYRTLRASEQADDAENADQFGYVSKAGALKEMQVAWIAWRDATCDYERAQWGGGTGGGPATGACLMRLTGEQTLYLEAMAAEY